LYTIFLRELCAVMKQLLIIILLWPLSIHAAKTYVFSGGANNVPHSVAAKVLQKAYQQAGLKIKPKFMELQSALELSNSGATDGEISRIAGITKFTPNLLQIPVSTYSVQAVAFSKDKSLKINTWQDLQGYDITLVKGAKFIETATQNFERELVDSFTEAFERLQRNETYIVVVPKLTGLAVIYKNNYHEIKAVSESLQTLKLYHYVHKKNKHLISIIEPILKGMEQSGEIGYIRKSYIMQLIKMEER
jgi:polar amino acid transport system substrate-binding protein